MLRLVLVILIAFQLTSIILAGSPTVIIDGNTVNSHVDSPANLPLGTTLVLTCEVSGIPSGITPIFTWTCPNETCIQQGYAGREIRNNVLAINITSMRDNGTYTCTVSAGGCKGSGVFFLSINGGKVVHSYGRLIVHERVISDRRQLQPPNIPKGDGMVECKVSSGEALFSYHGFDVNQTRGSNAAVVIKEKTLLSGHFAMEGQCNGLFHYLFLKNDTIPNDLKWKYPNITRSHNSITVNASELPKGTDRVIIGYTRLDLGIPVEGEYVNIRACESKTFSSLVPGAKYRITAWGLGKGIDEDRRRCQSPIMILDESTLSQVPGKVSSLTITPIIINSSAGLLIEWEEPNSTSEIIAYNVSIYEIGKNMTGSLITTKNYQLVPGLKSLTQYRVTVAAISMGGRGAESMDNVNTSFVPEKVDECPSIPNPNTVTFNYDSMIVSESETLLHIDVYRYGQMKQLIKLSVQDQDGTAKKFEDYVLQSHSLYFTQMGQLVEKATVVVKIINDDKKESKEHFELILSTEDDIKFDQNNMTIYIKDDEKNGPTKYPSP